MKKVILYTLCLILPALGLQSCKSSDQKVQTEVENVIKNSYSGISSTVKDGVVTLTGTLNSEAERSSVESVTRAINGVKSVVNNITVNAPAPVIKVDPDQTIQSNITSLLSTAGYKNVIVAVMNGEVTLSGEAKRADIQKIMQIANEANVKKVINNISLK